MNDSSDESLDSSINNNRNMLKFLLVVIVFSFMLIWILVKLIFAYICHKYKCKVKFKFSRIYQLKNINIIKHLNGENQQKKLVHLTIGNFFISSCYLNRNINERLLVCLSNVILNVNSFDDEIDQPKDEPNLIKSNTTNYYYYTTKTFNYLMVIFFKYFASLRIDNLNINFNKNIQQLSALSIPKFEIKFAKISNCETIETKFNNLNLSYKLNLVNLQIESTKTNFMLKTGKKLIDSIEKIEIAVNDVSISNKLTINEFYKSLIDNSNISFAEKSKNDDEFSLINKLKSIKIKNLKYNFNDREDDFMKLDEFSLENNYDLVFLNHLDYYKLNRYKYSLLDRLEFRIKNHDELYIELMNSNFYFNIDILINFLKQNDLSDFLKANNNKIGSVNFQNKFKIINSNLINFYFNLVYNGYKNDKIVYTIGSNSLSFDIDFNKNNSNFGKKFELLLKLESFIVFKSKLEPKRSRSNNLISDFTNNLFDNRQNLTLAEILNKIDSVCVKNKSCHYWGQMLKVKNMNLRIKIKNNSKLHVDLNIDHIIIEYLSEIIRSITDCASVILNNYKNYQSITTNSSVQRIQNVKISIKTAYIYYLYRDIYLLNLNFTNFYMENYNRNKSVRIDKINCLQFAIEDIEPYRSNILNNKQLKSSFIDIFQEDDEEDSNSSNTKNYNLLLLAKSISLNKIENDYYICINDVLLTWSLQIHFILHEILIKPLNNYEKLSELISVFSKNEEIQNISLNILIESNILVNFLFNYQHDSSKILFAQNLAEPSTPTYFNNAHPTNSLIHTVSIIINNAYFYKKIDSIHLNINDISVLINADDQNIFSDFCILHSTSKLRKFVKIKQFCINFLSPENSTLLHERSFLNTQQKKNQLISIKYDLLDINFLFNYDFAKLFDHLLNLRKCLYVIHDISQPSHCLDSSNISADLLIIIKRFQLTIEDDPFEVKLAYNYALMSDEYLESVKRRQTLEQRRSIKEQNLEQEALEILREKESKIYLQRSKMIYQPSEGKNNYSNNGTGAESIRTQLFCFCIDNLEFSAIADKEWHGRQKCYDILRKIDKFSPPPPPPSSISSVITLNTISSDFNPANHFLTLFCRYINFKADDFCFLFRDYTQPLLKMNKLNLFGKFLGSEYEPAPRAKRDIKIGLGTEFPEIFFMIQRSMSPFKIYYDLNTKMDLFTFAYGPCWEGCMAQLNLSLDKIIHPARDPSKPMPWWDKCRLYMHGRITSLIEQSQTIYHVSMDPYNRTEEMKWVDQIKY